MTTKTATLKCPSCGKTESVIDVPSPPGLAHIIEASMLSACTECMVESLITAMDDPINKPTYKVKRTRPGLLRVIQQWPDGRVKIRTVRYNRDMEQQPGGREAVLRWAEAGFPLRYFDRPGGGPVLRVPKEIP